MAGDLYLRTPLENRIYKDGSRAKDLGVVITTNPFTFPIQDWFIWNDGWNKIPADKPSFLSTWNFLTSITNADPGLGNLKHNAVTFATTTALYESFTNGLGGNTTEKLFNVKSGDVIKLYNAADATNFVIFTVNASVTQLVFATIGVTYGSSAGALFVNNTSIVMQVNPT